MRISHQLRSAGFILVLLTSLSAAADNTTSNTTESKLAYIQAAFDRETDHARLWQQGWLGLFSASAALQGLAYTQTENEPNLTDRAVGFTTSALGAIDLLINPLKTHVYAQDLQKMSDDTPEQQLKKLKQAEQWMAQVAERESYEQSWLNHLAAGIVNGIAGVVVANEGDRPTNGWLTFASGFIASEIKIYTAPDNMSGVLEKYRQGDLTTSASSKSPRWQFAAYGPVLAAQYRF